MGIDPFEAFQPFNRFAPFTGRPARSNRSSSLTATLRSNRLSDLSVGGELSRFENFRNVEMNFKKRLRLGRMKGQNAV